MLEEKEQKVGKNINMINKRIQYILNKKDVLINRCLSKEANGNTITIRQRPKSCVAHLRGRDDSTVASTIKKT